MPTTHLSFVVPVRDGQQDIALRIESAREALGTLTERRFEIVTVDDGSHDATAEIVAAITQDDPRVRLLRHPRPRGIEAAGQTGLERATGELVFIPESELPIRIDDLRQLYRLAEESTLVAARAASDVEPVAPTLLRRLRQWGADSAKAAALVKSPARYAAIQMIRRRHLQTLSGPEGRHYRLESSVDRIASTRSRRDSATLS